MARQFLEAFLRSCLLILNSVSFAGCTSCSRPALHVSATYASYNCVGRQRSPEGARDTLLFCKRIHFLPKQGLQWGPSEPAFQALKERFADLDVGGADPEDDSPEDASFLLAEDLQRRPSPRGFGAGTLYDTSIEEELMRDIEGGKEGERKKRQAGDAPAVQRSEQGNGRTRRPPPREAPLWLPFLYCIIRLKE